MKLCVLGQGYIGLPTALLFAKNGCDVVGVDIDELIISSLTDKKVTIEEEGLQDILIEVMDNGNYHAKTSPEKADAFIITVPTPYIKNNYECDLTYVISACESILPYLDKGNIVIIESTIAPLSMKNVIAPLFEKNGFVIGKDLFLAHCPERVLPGNLIYELINNNRIVGGMTENSTKKAANVYNIFVKGNIVETTSEVAEMSKCMENTFRDVNIALANELVKICSNIDVNALDVIKIANQHPRVNIHSPGPGVGGHCLAIDPYFIYAVAPIDANIIKLSRDVNESMPKFVVEKTKKIMKCYADNSIISVFGVAYKGNSDDDRESPAYKIIDQLNENYNIKIYDPHIEKYNNSFENVVEDSSLILVLTDHDEFKDIDYDVLMKKMKNTIIFDTRDIINDNVPDGISLFNYGNIYLIN